MPTIHFKIQCENTGELRRYVHSVDSFPSAVGEVSAFLAEVQSLFLPGSRGALLKSFRFLDEDQDWITVSSDRELAFAFSSATSSATSPIRISVRFPPSSGLPAQPPSANNKTPTPAPTAAAVPTAPAQPNSLPDFDAMLSKTLQQMSTILESPPTAARLQPEHQPIPARNPAELLQEILLTPIVQQQILPLILSGLFPQLAQQPQPASQEPRASSSSQLAASSLPAGSATAAPAPEVDERLSGKCESTTFDLGKGMVVWKLKNNGQVTWLKGTRFTCTDQRGCSLFVFDSVPVPEVKPGKTHSVSMQIKHSDQVTESATATFRLIAPTGSFFGEPATAVIDREIATRLREEQSLMRQLNDMGFNDSIKNLALIRKHKFDLARIISDLIELG